jgi:pilus assembly protein CpaF
MTVFGPAHAAVPDDVLVAVRDHLARDGAPLTPQRVAQALREDGRPVGDATVLAVHDALRRDVHGAGPLDPLLAVQGVTDVLVNGPGQVWLDRGDGVELTDMSFPDEDAVRRLAQRLAASAGRRLDDASPYVDLRLPDGTRFHAVLAPIARPGTVLSLRVPRRRVFSLDDLREAGALSSEGAALLHRVVRRRLAFLVSGGTGSGKTTLLNVLSSLIPKGERIVTIEDAAELQLQQEHVITLESRPPNIEGVGEIRIRELVRNALRMRPDRIIVGEVRGAETLDMLQAMNTGHEGSLTTIHANTPRDALSRLETLVLTAGVDLPLRAIREQTSSAFDLLVQISRLVDGSRRVTHITEVLRMESDVITLQDLFLAKPPDEEAVATRGSRLLSPLACTGLKPHFLEKMAANGVVLPPNFFRAEENGARPSFGATAYGGNG